MNACAQCGGEHEPPRKARVALLGIAEEWGRFVARPEIWPGYLAWLRERHGDAIIHVSDSELRTNTVRAGQGLIDLMAGFDPAADLLFLRQLQIGGIVMVTAGDAEPPAVVGVNFSSDDDHGIASVAWVVDRDSAAALTALLREQLGEPDMDAITGREGAERMQEAFEENSIHTHKDMP